MAHTCFNLYIFRNGFFRHIPSVSNSDICIRFSHDGQTGFLSDTRSPHPWLPALGARMGCFVRVVSMPLPISCWMRSAGCGGVGWGWFQNSQGTHASSKPLVLDPIQKNIYILVLKLVSRMVFRFFGNFSQILT